MADTQQTNSVAFPEVLREGLPLLGILVVWGIFAIVGVGIGNIGGSGSFMEPIGEALSMLFLVVGFLNGLVYVVARGISLSE